MDSNTVSNGQFVPNNTSSNYNAGGIPVISSGTGDIILTSAPGNKDRKHWPIIVAIAVLFMIAIVTGIAAVVVGQNQGDKDTPAALGNVKTAFNEYINYLISGVNSSKDLTAEQLESPTPFAYTLKVEGRISELGTYAERLSNKYQDLTTVYVGNYLPSDINDYFYNYVVADLISSDDILKLYTNFGKEEAQDRIISTYNTDGGNYGMNYMDFVTAELEFGLMAVRYYATLDSNGCLLNGENDMECAGRIMKENEEVAHAMERTSQRVSETASVLRTDAITALHGMYDEIYEIVYEAGE